MIFKFKILTVKMAETIIETEKHVKTLSRPLLSKKNKERSILILKALRRHPDCNVVIVTLYS